MFGSGPDGVKVFIILILIDLIILHKKIYIFLKKGKILFIVIKLSLKINKKINDAKDYYLEYDK